MKIRLALVAPGNPEDIGTYSGVPYFAMSALMRREEVDVIPIDAGIVSTSKTSRAINRVSERALGRKLRGFEPSRFYMRLARKADALIERSGANVILCMNVDPLVGKLNARQPVILNSDATIGVMLDYYPRYRNLSPRATRHAHALTHASLSRACAATYPSRWAAKSAHDIYGVPRASTHVLPYGANLLSAPEPDEIAKARTKQKSDICRMLFIGREWERKGGPLMIAAFDELKSQGLAVEATVVGCDPGIEREGLSTYAFLDKRKPEERAIYESLWPNATFLVMPSHHETFGAIYAEAAAQGVPAIALDTGGVGDAIADGVSGRLLPEGATGQDIAGAMMDAWPGTAAYAELCTGARSRYETVLNWDSWAAQVSAIAHQAIGDTQQDTPGV